MIDATLFQQFSLHKHCYRPEWALGQCVEVSLDFLAFAERHGFKGYLLGADSPKREPDKGYGFWGTTYITHYTAFFPKFDLVYDWTARQFWKDAAVPLILTPTEMAALWGVVSWNIDVRKSSV